MKMHSFHWRRTGKVIPALLLIAATMMSAVGCDILPKTDDSESQTEAFTYPEIETEKYQTLTAEELNINFTDKFVLKDALSGKYLERFNEEVYNGFRDTAIQEDLKRYYSACGDVNIQNIIDSNMQTTQTLSDLLNSTHKKLSINISTVNDVINEYSLVIDDEKNVFAIVKTDIYTGKQEILNGIVGNNYFTGAAPLALVSREKDITLVKSYLQENEFGEFSSAILSYIPSCIYTVLTPSPYHVNKQQLGETPISYFIIHKNDNNNMWEHKPYLGFALGISSTNNNGNVTISSININSGGFDVYTEEGKVNVPMGTDLVKAEVKYNEIPKIIEDQLGLNEQEAQPEAE